MNYDLQKASLLKRFSAFLLDAILLLVLACGCGLLVASVLDYDSNFDALQAIYDRYEDQYGVNFDASYDELSDAAKEAYNAAAAAMEQDPEALRCMDLIYNMGLLIVTFGLLLSFMALEFVVPLLLKNGQTIGKKIFGIALVRVDGVKITTFALFVRTLLGKFTIETMVPLMVFFLMMLGVMGLLGPVLLLGIVILQIVLMITSRTNSTIHDYLAVTVAVDLSSQMIFSSPEELMAYRQRLHAEKVSKSPY